MKVLGFNLTKISGERTGDLKNTRITPNIEFTDLGKEKADILKESEALRVNFKHDLTYTNSEKNEPGKISFEGIILLSVTSEESKDFLKSWKKKNFPEQLRLPLSNLILRRCTTKALQLQDELNIPTHVPMPKLDKRN